MLKRKEIETILRKCFPELEETDEDFEGRVVYVVNGWIEFFCCYFDEKSLTEEICLWLYTQKKVEDYKSHQEIISDLQRLDAIADDIILFSKGVIKRAGYYILPRMEYEPGCHDFYPTTECLSCCNLDLAELTEEGLEALANKINAELK